jgi:hypothetical protein
MKRGRLPNWQKNKWARNSAMKFSHPIFGTGTKISERTTDSGLTVFEIRFADCTRIILSNCVSPVPADKEISAKRAGVASPRVKSVATEERRRPRPSFEKKV